MKTLSNNQRYEQTFDYAFDENGLNGFNSDYDLQVIVGKVVKPIAPTMQENFQDIPARYGGIYLGTDYQEKEIDIPITVMCESESDYTMKVENLSSILVNSSRDKDVQYPMRFNSDPDVVYYGHFTQIPQPQFVNDTAWDFTLTLTFMLADPRGFLPDERIQVTSNNQTIIPKGNTEVKPIIHIIPKNDIYYFGYDQDEHYVAVGYNVNDGNTLTYSDGTVEEANGHQWLQVDDPCLSLATWFQAGSDTQNVTVYNGDNDGKAMSTPTSITVGKNSKGNFNFGTSKQHSYNKNGQTKQKWYGPVLIHNGLPRITPYWKMQVRLHHVKLDKRNRAMGRVEVYLLDAQGNVKGRMGIQDLAHGRYPVAYVQLGSSFNKSDDKGKYSTIIWTQGPPNQKHDDGKKEYKVYYTKEVKVAVKSKKTSSKRSLDAIFEEGEIENRKRTYTKHKGTRKSRSDKGKTHRTRKVKTVKSKKGGKEVTVSKPKVKTVKKTYVENESSYRQSDAFSDFFGSFSLERSRGQNGKDLWTAQITRLSTSSVTPVTSKSQKVDIKKTVVDNNNSWGFSLANVAVAMMKMDITEDLVNPAQGYRNDFLSITDYKEWRTDGSTDPDDTPHVICPAGKEIIIDNTDEHVYIDGKSADKYVSWGSDFPTISGGVPQSLHFTPSVENADVYIDYKPAIK